MGFWVIPTGRWGWVENPVNYMQLAGVEVDGGLLEFVRRS